MLVTLLFVLTIGYQIALLRRGRMFAWVRVGFRARHLRWAATLWIGYGATALIGLIVVQRLFGIWVLPAELRAFAFRAGVPPGSIGAGTVAIGLGTGSLLGLLLTWWRARRGRAPWAAGNVSAVMPTSDADLLPAAVLAVSAGTAEELFYRLYLPLIVAMATGSGLAGTIVATTAFAAMHRYQGWIGMAATFVGGGLLAALYMGTGALWVPMAVHVLVDLNALVLRPALSARVRRRLSSSAASRS
jgi:membrane protease YdiL (CAAX protease family)